MRHGMIGAALGVLALVGWLMAESGTTASVDSTTGRQAGGDLVPFQVPAANGVHLYIVDGRRHWFGVYELDLESGDCKLKVARDFSGDIELVQAGGKHYPSPQAVKRMVRRQRDK
jgi:hypothetical protein